VAGRGNKHSKAKYEELVRNGINSALRRDVADARLSLCTITKVELTDEYDYAKVWWDTFDSSKRGDIKEALEGVKGKIRSLLASRLDVRHVPELQFHYDSQFEDEQRIAKLLKDTVSDGSDT
jgi:ribosome-binding factor A